MPSRNCDTSAGGLRIADRCVTLLCWAWFTCGFLVFFSVPYAFALLFKSETAVQHLNSLFTRILFAILRITAPAHKINIAPEVSAIRSGVIVCNHRSYLDPLLLITIFPRHRTIVKTRFFSLPIFGNVLTGAGYIPASSEGLFASLMIKQMETMDTFLQTGGNLFVFPEGTRSPSAGPGSFHPGALKIARLCRAPIYVVQITNTDILFPPGKFLFNSRQPNTISLRLLGSIQTAPPTGPPLSTAQLEQQVLNVYQQASA